MRIGDRFVRFKLIQQCRCIFNQLSEKLDDVMKQAFEDFVKQAETEFRKGNSRKLRQLLETVQKRIEAFNNQNPSAVQ